MDRLRVSTIDALIGRMARASAMELETAPGWRIGEESELAVIRGEAIAGALSEGDRDQTRGLVRSLSRNPLSRQVHTAMERAVKEAHGVFAACGGDVGLWGVVGASGRELGEAELAQAVEVLRGAPVPVGKKGPDGRFVKAVESLVGMVARGEWESVVGKGLGSSYLGEGTYFRVAMPEGLMEAVGALVEHARWRLTSGVAERNRATAALLERYDRLAREGRNRAGVLEFDDVPRLLGEAVVKGRLEELWYRLDSGIDELMIDEAQDTSLVQFWMMRPILEELLSGDAGRERGVMIVGDVKQSLYGWRQAESELLPTIGAIWPQFTRRSLTESFRSSQVVLDAVNEVFGSLDGNGALGGREGAGDAGRRFAGQFKRHTASARAGGPGLVRVRTHPWVEKEEEGGRDKADRVAGTVAAVKELVDEAAAAGRRAEIGVLVRANKPIRALVGALRAAGIDASEEGGGTLDEDPAVSAALSLLWWADHPTDELALFHAAMGPIGAAVGGEGVPERGRARQQAARLRAMLVSRGYAGVLGRLARRASGRLTAASNERMDQLVELAREFEARGSLRASEFVEMVCERKVERPGGAAVRVMTVHRSKGLEFDAVVLGWLDEHWGPKAGGAMLRRDGALGAATGASLSVSADVARLDPVLAEMARRREERCVFEELCGLYVGMTRAKRALVLVVDAYAEKKELPLRASGVLRGSLCAEVVEAGAGVVVREERHGQWWEGLERVAESVGAAGESGAPSVNSQGLVDTSPARGGRGGDSRSLVGEGARGVELVLSAGSGRSLRRAAVVSPSSMEGGGRVDLGRRMSVEGGSGRDVGTVVHAMLALVEWLEDGRPGRQELEASGRASGGEAQVVGVAAGMVDRMLDGRGGECLRRAWHGASADERLEVRREWRFLHEYAVEGEARLVSGVIDRLVLRWRGGAVVGADVIDYKTDSVSGEGEVAERVAYYGPQVRAYCGAVERMFGVGGVRGVLVFVGSGEAAAL